VAGEHRRKTAGVAITGALVTGMVIAGLLGGFASAVETAGTEGSPQTIAKTSETAKRAGTPTKSSVTRDRVVAVALAEVGNSTANGKCSKYGPCQSAAWCAMFARWVWRTAGVRTYPTTNVATETAVWGKSHGLWKPRPAGSRGSPAPGDMVVWGAPGSGTGGHVGIVYAVNRDGTITTVEGNLDHAVKKRTFDPRTKRSGTRNVLISGYVSPPGVTNPPPRAYNGKSINGDGYADLAAVDRNSVMWLYPGKANARYGKRIRIGSGWQNSYNRIALGDANADGHADVFATATDGKLFYWQNRGGGRYVTRRQVGRGWKTVRWFAVADANGDHRADLLGVRGDSLLLYLGKGDGRFRTAKLLSRGWSKFHRIVAGDVNRDGRADIFGIDRTGVLWYAQNSRRGWGAYGVSYSAPRRVGHGWIPYRQVYAADVDGDQRTDLVAVRSDGTLWHYRGVGNGGFHKAQQVGRSWSGLRVATY